MLGLESPTWRIVKLPSLLLAGFCRSIDRRHLGHCHAVVSDHVLRPLRLDFESFGPVSTMSSLAHRLTVLFEAHGDELHQFAARLCDSRQNGLGSIREQLIANVTALCSRRASHIMGVGLGSCHDFLRHFRLSLITDAPAARNICDQTTAGWPYDGVPSS